MISDLLYSRKKTSVPTSDLPLSLPSLTLLEEADKLGISWKEIPGTRIYVLTYRGISREYYFQVPSATTAIATYATEDKSVTSSLLEAANISVSKGYYLIKLDSEEYWLSVYEALAKPLVVKPTHGSHGTSVYIDIDTKEDFLKTVKECFSQSSDSYAGVMVEEMFEGTEYRILATQEKVVSIVNRVPAYVIGDGTTAISELIKHQNQHPYRIINKSFIDIDTQTLELMTEQRVSLDTILAKGERIELKRVSNISQGGESIDVTDEAHSSVIEIALKTMKAIPGLAFAGIDFMTKDITKPQTNDSYIIIEVNYSPGLDIHDMPMIGKKRGAAREFICLLFPEFRAEFEQLPL